MRITYHSHYVFLFLASSSLCFFFFFFFNDTATTEIYTLSLHDALPICLLRRLPLCTSSSCCKASCTRCRGSPRSCGGRRRRSGEHTSELQSPCNLVCRLLLEKKKKKYLFT